MPFISSVGGALGGQIWPLSKASAPTVSISSTTNFNQSVATFNGTVSANGATTTTIKFQISTDNSNWSDATGGTTISNTSSQSVSVYYNATGLSVGTLYYVRLVATNSAGTTNSSSTSFTTWNIQVYERTTSGGTTFTIPTVTPTGGSAVTVSIYDIIMFGGGGGAGTGGGGGGGYQSLTSASLSGSRSITTSVGGAGANEGANPPVAGGATTISGDISTLTASGGGVGSGFSSGSSGNGNAGGGFATYDYSPGDKLGYTNAGCGGGGGAGGNGSGGAANSSGTYGGTGGTGVSITRGGVTVAGGAGGGGGTSTLDGGPSYPGARGSNSSYGSGGNGFNSFTAREEPQGGYIRFRYYASSALA